MTFTGRLVAFASENEWAKWYPLLLAIPIWISAIGSMKSAGFGQVEGIEIGASVPTAIGSFYADAPPTERVCYEIRFDRPLLVDAKRVA
ncbi:hypothetical protein [Palleronia caenipelagi]|uniref:Uncharacterized protein n=1 Tax=Palleronia caenipelagi TaxID=2489174 RepID=A0A547PKY5_9RHOB|nr:hypothetical protein [Palleronia caenipelagi]TRD14807.1 hypothetical protein FEV53_18330 [Palleronia caenipelagi]